jgi:protein-tyrosine phosphatase
VLFVCMGNICRSPTAEGVFRALVEREGLADRVRVASAGTHGYHEGDGADERARAAAAERGIDLSRHVARRVQAEDFHTFDFILTMDRVNQSDLLSRAPAAAHGRIRMLMGFAPDMGAEEVPDPYYGGPRGFGHVLDLIEAAAAGVLEEARALLVRRAAGLR